MTPTSAPNTTQVVLVRLDAIDLKLLELAEKIDCLTREETDFRMQYTKSHAELAAEVKRVDEKASRAHERIDAITKLVWSIALPVVLGALAFLWALATHTINIGTP